MLLISSCSYNPFKAVQKIERKAPLFMVEYCAQKFAPNIETKEVEKLIPGTEITNYQTDTIKQFIIKKIFVKRVDTVVKEKTNTVENTARIEQLKAEKNKQYLDLNTTIATISNKLKAKEKWLKIYKYAACIELGIIILLVAFLKSKYP